MQLRHGGPSPASRSARLSFERGAIRIVRRLAPSQTLGGEAYPLRPSVMRFANVLQIANSPAGRVAMPRDTCWNRPREKWSIADRQLFIAETSCSNLTKGDFRRKESRPPNGDKWREAERHVEHSGRYRTFAPSLGRAELAHRSTSLIPHSTKAGRSSISDPLPQSPFGI